MKKLRSLTLALLALLALTSCAPSEQVRWHAGSGQIKIVASTDVWGSVANLVAGESATVDAIIYNTNQDPHSYELTARDQLMINNADIVIMNGGGYDDFMQKAIEADPTPAIVVNAFQASGPDITRNEHIWYDVDQVGAVASAIAAAIEKFEPATKNQVEMNDADFQKQIAARKAQLDEHKKVLSAAFVSQSSLGRFLTEPLVAYLVEDAGYLDVTPPEFSRAVEEERDIPPATLQKAKTLIMSGQVGAIYVNNSTQTTQITSLLSLNPKVPNYGFSELLIQDPDTQKYEGGYFELLDSAIREVFGK